jgi:hypothetical protein
MNIRLCSALGLTLLAASFTFGGSPVYAEVPEATTSSVQTVVPDNEANVTEGLSDCSNCQVSGGQVGDQVSGGEVSSVQTSVDQVGGEVGGETSVVEAQPAALDQASSVLIEIEPFSSEAYSPPVIRFVDAIVIEVTQTVTIAVPGQDVEDNEEPLHTGSIPDGPVGEAAVILEEQTADLDGAK